MTYTHLDYKPGHPRYNAEVFRAVWHRTVEGVEDEGIFYTTDSGGGHMQAFELAQEMQMTDTADLLTLPDYVDAVGQLLRSTAPMFYENLDLPDFSKPDPSWLEGEQDTGDF